MKQTAYATLCLAAMAGPALAQAHRFDNKPCSELRAEVESFLSQDANKGLDVYDADSPMMIVIETAMSELDNEAA